MTDHIKKKPFDLERAIAGDPVVTRDGRTAQYSFYEPSVDDGKSDCVGFVIDGKLRLFNSKGEYIHGLPVDRDLFMVPKRKTYWFASWKYKHNDETRQLSAYAYEDKEEMLDYTEGRRGEDMRVHSFEIEE